MQVRRALAVPGFNPDTIDTASGMSLLMWAATYGQDDIVKLLLRRGAGVNYTDQKRNAVTALMQAAEQVILLERKAHITFLVRLLVAAFVYISMTSHALCST